MASRLGTTPSTQARRLGYAKLHRLKHFLFKLLDPKNSPILRLRVVSDHWLETAFSRAGWKDYMEKHLPSNKRGGPKVMPPSRSKRKKQNRKLKERKDVIEK